MEPSLRLIITGGTIDKKYNPLTGEMGFADTHIPAILNQARVFGGRIVLEKLMMKDSLDMTDSDREAIANAVITAKEDKMVITHGTDTMVQTGRTICAREIGDKTVVLTGAMIPYSLGVESDAQFNLGTALAYAEVLPSGVYVAMNGRHFDIDNVTKDTSLGVFTELPANSYSSYSGLLASSAAIALDIA